jgi:hypothetical protein
MAMCWIERVENRHPSSTMQFELSDPGRTGRVRGEPAISLSPGTWYSVPAGQERRLENTAVPWSGNGRALTVRWFAAGRTQTLRFDIANSHGWDFLRSEGNADGAGQDLEVGSMGDAAGTNHSGWTMSLEPDGSLKLRCEWRQGLTLTAAQKLGSAVGAAAGVAWAVASVVGLSFIPR